MRPSKKLYIPTAGRGHETFSALFCAEFPDRLIFPWMNAKQIEAAALVAQDRYWGATNASHRPLVLWCMNPLPTSREAWLNEIAGALRDAAEAIPFGPLVGASFGAAELFHLGPVTALKFRGMRRSKRIEREITEAALGSYVVTESKGAGSLTDPRVAFAFTYLASHFALNLLTEQQVAELMDYIESHPEALRIDLDSAEPG